MLIDEIRKLGVDEVRQMNEDQLAGLEKAIEGRDMVNSEDESDRSTTVDTSDMYTKESMERRYVARY